MTKDKDNKLDIEVLLETNDISKVNGNFVLGTSEDELASKEFIEKQLAYSTEQHAQLEREKLLDFNARKSMEEMKEKQIEHEELKILEAKRIAEETKELESFLSEARNRKEISCNVSQGIADTLSKIDLPLNLLSTNEELKFSKNVSEVVSSKEFLHELAAEVGPPDTTEEKDEFVDRACGVLRKKLYSIFKLK